jgi:hypothetical protein
MGQVYQATDTTLNRQVALMVTSTREACLSFSPDGQGNDFDAQLMETKPATLIRGDVRSMLVGHTRRFHPRR